MIENIAKREFIAIDKDASLSDAISLMMKNSEGMVVFLDGKKAIGILTERDLLYILKTEVSLQTKASKYYAKTLISIHPNRSLEYALHILIDNNIRRLIIRDDSNEFIGIVTQEMILNFIERDTYRIHLSVSDIIRKHHEVASVEPMDSIEEALSVMRDRSIGSVIVKDSGTLVGIFTERDIIKVIDAKIPTTTPIREVMNSPVITIKDNLIIADATEIMREKKIRRLVVTNSSGDIVGIIGTRDIMKNIQGNYATLIEHKLKIAKNTLDSLPNMMIVELFGNRDLYHIHWLNSIAKRVLGDILDDDICTIIEPDLWKTIMDRVDKEQYSNDARITINDATYTLSISKYIFQDYDLVRILFVDITEFERELTKAIDSKQKMLEQLMQQSRLAQMGEMISMIAHQWRQPLSAISTTVGTLKLKNMLDDYDRDFFDQKLDQIILYSQHLSDTINDFRDFFKRDKLLESQKLTKIIKATTIIIQPSLDDRGISLVFNLEEDIIINTYINEFKQVILNILQNAYDVLVDREIKEPKITIRSYKDDRYIFLEIGDNGGGIPDDIITNIFNPYFTTKAKDGTGLGLYMSQMIIRDHCKGSLEVENSDLGAIFTIKVKL